MTGPSAEKDATAFERAATDEGLLLRAVTEMGSHVEQFSAWFENGRKVRHEDVGGIQCTCGWNYGPEGGFRPWQRFKAHQLREGLLAVGRVTSPAETWPDAEGPRAHDSWACQGGGEWHWHSASVETCPLPPGGGDTGE